jgi:hypothetical protein
LIVALSDRPGLVRGIPDVRQRAWKENVALRQTGKILNAVTSEGMDSPSSYHAIATAITTWISVVTNSENLNAV